MRRKPKTNWKKFWLIVAALVLMMSASLPILASPSLQSGSFNSRIIPAADPTTPKIVLEFTPSTMAVGKEVKLAVKIQDVVGLYGAEVHLSYDPQLLEVIDANPNEPGTQIADGTIWDGIDPEKKYRTQTVNEVAVDANGAQIGKILYASSLMTTEQSFSGTGVLAEVTFKVKGPQGTAGTPVGVNFDSALETKLSDRAANSITFIPQAGTLIVDNQAPVTSMTISPASPDGQNGWYKTKPVVTFTTETGAKTYYYFDNGQRQLYDPQGGGITINDTQGTELSFFSVDLATNEEKPQSIGLKVDTQAPSTTDDASGAWTNRDVTVTLTATDATSGVAEIYYNTQGSYATTRYTGPFTLAESGLHQLKYYALDKAGNVETEKPGTLVRIDKVVPSTSDDAPVGWQKQAFTVTLTAANDNLSPQHTWYTLDGSDPVTSATRVEGNKVLINKDGIYQLKYYTEDEAGNKGTVVTRELKLDTQAPTVTAEAPQGWQTSKPVQVKLTAEDRGSGVQAIYYAIGAGQFTEVRKDTVTIEVSAEGQTVIRYYALDNAGNKSEERTVEVKVATSVGAVPPPPPPAPTSGAGNVIVDKSTGSVTVEVKPEKVEELLSKAGEAKDVIIDIPQVTGMTINEKSVEIPTPALDKVAEKGKNLVINAGEVSLSLPPAAIDVGEVAGSATDVKLKVSAKVLKDEEIKDLLKDLPASELENMKAAGNIVEVDLKVVSQGTVLGSVTSFDKPVEVALNYDPTASADPTKLGIYRIEEKDGKIQWVYVGGKVDKGSGRIFVLLRHFSKYGVMAYSRTFADIKDHWASGDIELMASRHVVKGVSADIFQPDGHVTRAQFAALLQRALMLPEVSPLKPTFGDVEVGAWYYKAVEAAAQASLVLGYDDGTFRPEEKISRAEMATMIVRALKFGGKPVTLSTQEVGDLLARFKDAGEIQTWAKENAAIAIKAGIVRGRTDTSFVPKGTATRAEGVTMLKRLLTYLGEL